MKAPDPTPTPDPGGNGNGGNDPFDGGMHLPDIFIFKPLYHAGERLAFACTVCHHTDVGGRVAGSNASDSTEIYAEGLRIAPMKLYEGGKLNKTIITFIEKNVRVPVMVMGDLRAQLAACHIAEQQFADIVAKWGPAMTKQLMNETIDYSERLTRAALEELPDGEWSFEDWIDDDGVDVGKPIRLFVTLRKKGDHMIVDWTGTVDTPAPPAQENVDVAMGGTQAVKSSMRLPVLRYHALDYAAVAAFATTFVAASRRQLLEALARALADAGLVELLVAEIRQVDGVAVEDVRPVSPDRPEGGMAALMAAAAIVGAPAGERAFHIHAVGKCEPPFTSAGGHFNPASKKHGIAAAEGSHAGDMPNLHVPASGELMVEILNGAVTLEKGKANSVFDSDGSAIVIHAGVDDYKTDPTGNAGDRIACGVIQ